MTLKIEAGKKYRTRGGDEVEVLRTNINSDDSVVGVITFKEAGDQSIATFKESGSYLESEAHRFDLISEVKPKRVVWLNVYPGGHAYWHSSRVEAEKGAGAGAHRRIACIRVEFEEGQFDE